MNNLAGKLILTLSASCAAALVACLVPAAHAQPHPQQARPVARYVEPASAVRAVRYVDGAAVELPSETVWRPMCGGPADVPAEELKRIAALVAAGAHQQAALAGSGPSPSGSLDLVLNLTTSFPPEAVTAMAELEKFIESRFTDPVQVRVNVAFAPVAGGGLGAASVTYLNVPWSSLRAALIADADGTDTIHAYLPAGGTIPVRYDANSATVMSEDRVFVPLAPYVAAVGEASGLAASLVFNSGVPWDFAPPIGPGQYSFRDVFVHEVGHALGFLSAVDGRITDIELLDIFRFQLSDGAFNYNPDTPEQFAITPRTVDYNPPPPADSNDDVVCDVIAAEYRMADGLPYQASHFFPSIPGIYVMDPTFVQTETFYPDYLREGDLAMLDAIGWDYPPENAACESALELGCGLRHLDNRLLGGAPDPAFSCGAGVEHNGAVWFFFVADSPSARISTCGSPAADSTMAVYEGACGSLTEIACSEDSGCVEPGLSQLCLDGLVVGQTYYVQLASRTTADRGIYGLELTCYCDAICADVCCHGVDAPQQDAGAQAVSRYFSFTPANPGAMTALRVTFDSLYDPQPPNPPGPQPDFSTHEGLAQWVGPPEDYLDDTIPPQWFRAAKLQCQPHYRDWGAEGTIQITGPEVVPSSIYSVQAVDERCMTAGAGEDGFSESLTVRTARWADVVPPYQDEMAANPDQPNVLDVSAVIDKVKGVVSAPSRVRAQLQPDDPGPSSTINVLDISNAVDALLTYRYPFSGPRTCP